MLRCQGAMRRCEALNPCSKHRGTLNSTKVLRGILWASFSTINVDQRGRKTGSERTVVVNCEPYPESLIHHGRHKTKSGGFSNSSDNVLSVLVYLFDKHISLIDTCLSYIYYYNLGPVKNWSYIFLHTKKIHNPSNTPKPWPVCNSY